MSNKWKYPSRELGNRKQTYEYTSWMRMMQRCREGGSTQASQPRYIGCSVHPDWAESYDNYHEWLVTQVGYKIISTTNRPHQLDKDLLLIGNKQYSANACVLLPEEVNKFISFIKAKNTSEVSGVMWHNRDKIYEVRCGSGKYQRYLGRYACKDEAFLVYCEAKEERAKQLAERYKEALDVRAYNALLNFNVVDRMSAWRNDGLLG